MVKYFEKIACRMDEAIASGSLTLRALGNRFLLCGNVQKGTMVDWIHRNCSCIVDWTIYYGCDLLLFDL